MVALTAILVALTVAGFFCFRARNQMRWRKMIDAYADRELAQLRQGIHRPT